MGKSKRKWLNVCNGVWTVIMAILGFTACEHMAKDEYGVPYAKYKIKGKVIDSQKNPTSDIQIIIKRMQGDEPINPLGWDTLKTDMKGEFFYKLEEVTEDKFRINWQDIKYGLYEEGEREIIMPKPTGGKGWYRGESSEEITIELEEQIDGE